HGSAAHAGPSAGADAVSVLTEGGELMDFEFQGVNYSLSVAGTEGELRELRPREHPRFRASFTFDSSSGIVNGWRWCGSGDARDLRIALENRLRMLVDENGPVPPMAA